MESFETALVNAQSAMVSIALEYVGGAADEVYIYGLAASSARHFDVFYRINGKVVPKHRLNDAVEGDPVYDVSPARQRGLLQVGNDALKSLVAVADALGQPMPTEIKGRFTVATGKLTSSFRYDEFYTDSSEISPNEFFKQWLASVESGVGL